jgi:drug/metabolite transporter (DMT)-like permease
MPAVTIERQPLSLYGLWLNLVVVSGTWGSSFLFVKLISQAVPPFAFAAVRGFIAMAALLAWIVIRNLSGHTGGWRAQLADRKNFRHVLVLGTTNGWLTNVLIVVAVPHVDSSVVAMSQAAVPLMVAFLAHFLFAEERFRLAQLSGILVGLAGISLIIGPFAIYGAAGSLLGVGAMLLAALCYACGTVYGRQVAAADPTALACGQQAFGAVVAVVISLCIESPMLESQPARVWGLFVIIGVLCSAVPTVLYLRLLALTASVPAAFVAYLQPVWATLLGWTVLGERIQITALCGTGLVFAGIIMSTRRTAR